MDEDECDFQSPIGKIIKQINFIGKKPQIDDQLGEVIMLLQDFYHACIQVFFYFPGLGFV